MNIKNLQKLYDVGQKILDEKLPIAFGGWDCGTHACLSGWYAREEGFSTASEPYSQAKGLFGIDEKQREQLFYCASTLYNVIGHPADDPGPEAYAELEIRMEYLANLIGLNRDQIPPSVRQIFQVEIPVEVRV